MGVSKLYIATHLYKVKVEFEPYIHTFNFVLLFVNMFKSFFYTFLHFSVLCISMSWSLDVEIAYDDQIIGSKLVKQYQRLAQQPLFQNNDCLQQWLKNLTSNCEMEVSDRFQQREAARFMQCFLTASGMVVPSCSEGGVDKAGNALSPTRCLLHQGMSEPNLKIWATCFSHVKPMCLFFADARMTWQLRLWNGLKLFTNADNIVETVNNSTILRGIISQFIYVADYKPQFQQFRLISYACSFFLACCFAFFVNFSLFIMVLLCCLAELVVFVSISSEYLVSLMLRAFFLFGTVIWNKKYLARFILFLINSERRI